MHCLYHPFFRYAMPLQLIRILRIDRERGAFKTFHAVIKNHFKVMILQPYTVFCVLSDEYIQPFVRDNTCFINVYSD